MILGMNDRSCSTRAADGGAGLIGKKLADCHPGAAREKVAALFNARSTDCYTIENGGVKKQVCRPACLESGTYDRFCILSENNSTNR
jgi:hypothetical protein